MIVAYTSWMSFHLFKSSQQLFSCFQHNMLRLLIVASRTELLPALLKLLKDLEAEVRIAAAGKVPQFSRLLPMEQVFLSSASCNIVSIQVCHAVIQLSTFL